MQSIFWFKTFSIKIKKLNLVFKSLKLCFYVLFLIANRDTYAKVINIASICINTSRKLKNIDTIIAFINAINSSYVDRSLDSS